MKFEFSAETQHLKLQQLMEYVSAHSPYYQKIMAEYEVSYKSINSPADLVQLPFTTKDDLARYNDDFLCVPKNRIADFVTTSGTLSDPVAFYLTDADIERLAVNEAESFRCAGGSSEDIYQLTTTIDRRFMAGLAYWMGARKIGAGMIRVGPGAPFLQWESIQRFSPTVLIAIPSFIPRLLDYAEANRIDYLSSSIRSIICIGEPIRNADFSFNELGKRITSQWNVKLYSTYASTEMGAAFTECAEGRGGHLNPDLLVLEVVDDNGHAVKEGETGEVVITTLGVEGMPLLRYKTGDLCPVYYAPCACGRQSPRLGPVVGRKQQMIKFKGTTIYPPAIFDVLDMVKEIELYQVVVSRNEYGNDEVTILLPLQLQTPVFQEMLHSLFRSKLRVTPLLQFVTAQELSLRIYRQEKRKPEKLIYI
ncbi:phenylacetate--CoA ligase family protein [Dyadobacter sediminis]|uniref:Phenylacetate--CoA ligase n=1 Tax=Dyadobacter sediminis TaxID=1493691 RepID=A0A5R9KFA7_9BACT|nr:AMP-binding protein [Dyadobacter sediminis]TLU94738.1 phenylacetate--CoA ligase [Dyadobacter sediminis]GGB88580.1 phenylacetate--CoA ligase [Dyadobacter sediminis]